MGVDRRRHWDTVYGEKSERQLSWHEDDPALSLELAEIAGITTDSSVLDIGAGTSRLAPCLIERGLRDVTVLDVSAAALAAARARLGEVGEKITWIAADVTEWQPERAYDLWHDRAVFHFLTEARDRAAYLGGMGAALKPGGHAIIATFAPDGPETCSGLPVLRYSPETLGRILGADYERVAERLHVHRTPWGSPQSFQFSLFRKTSRGLI